MVADPPDGADLSTGAGTGAPLAVERLVLTDFRCYRTARLDVDRSAVVLTGPNGAGKTNLLEALSFLAPGRGLRRARLGEVDRRAAGPGGDAAGGDAPWSVAANLATPGGPLRIGTGREATSSGGERRAVRIDGLPAKSQAALAEHVAMVWLTPQMDRLFLEGAGARRRFLDRLVLGFDTEHAARSAAYEQALRERARLLRDGPQDAAWLAGLEETLARLGIEIAAARRDVAARLDAAAGAGVAGFPEARLALAGTVDGWLGTMPAAEAAALMRERLAQSRRSDAETGGAAVGPHRSDLEVRHGATGGPAGQCSTGEQKALLIAIVLAHARLQRAIRGIAPIMLLDEVAAHLDRTRRAALFAELEGLRAQVWMTGTEDELFTELRGRAQFVPVRDATLGS